MKECMLVYCTVYTYDIRKGLKKLPLSYVVKKDVKWAIAGRSQAKLDKLKEELVKIDPNAIDLDTIIVDTTIPSTIHGLVKDTKAIITSGMLI